MRKRTKLLSALGMAGALIAGSTAFLIEPAGAVHNLAFQLDGDVSHACPGSGPAAAVCTPSQQDWADLFNVATNNTTHTQTVSVNTSVVSPSNPTGFTAASFQRDFQSGPNCASNSTVGPFCTGDDTTFATGSKDTLDIPGWQCNHDNNVNSKIDIMNAYAAAYTDPATGDKILYFGLEKNKNNGTNDVGFWFLQDGTVNCSTQTGTTTFTGKHTAGDVLVVSEFTLGGGVSNITAYKWVGGANPLQQIATAANADCKTLGNPNPTDTLCATTNSGANPFNTNITTPWVTADATLGVGNTVVPPDFFEGGIDLTKAFGAATVPSCFATFLSDTRSSTALTSTLFDYTRGSLGQCNTTLSTQENAVSPLSIGTGTVSSGTDTATLNVTGSTAWGGTLTWYLCGPVATDVCDAHGVVVTSKTVSNTDNTTTYTSGTATLTSVGRYCWHAHFEPNAASAAAGVKPADDNGANECFTVNPVTPTLTTSATCSATPCILGSTLNDTATLTGTASRPGSNGPGGDTGLYKSINATNGTPADNSISWTLYGPASNGSAQCVTTKTLSPSTALVSGDGTYGPVSYTTNVATDGLGVYTFAASYPQDSVNTLAAADVSCANGASNGEQVTVTSVASTTTAQKWLPQDTATVTASGSATVAGTVSFSLYESGDCSGSAVQTFGPVTVDSNGQATTNNTTYYTTTKTISWRATFTSSNGVGSGSPSHCETMSVSTLNNDLGS